ncbi:MAG TPA: TldD/PmbA family protein [Gemmatimonadaceae bacterium]|nr:TldD/PmbA family protein [Gemmatimonadaceae bacterium]
MSPNRRDFVKAGAVAAAATIAVPQLLKADPPRVILRSTEMYADDLIMEALSAAKDAGAQYADARIGRYRRQSLNTREHQITGVSDAESYGIGIRTLVDGSWGFAATANMSKDSVVKTARNAVRLSRAAKSTQRRPVELALTPPVKGTWITPIKRDPIDVPIEEKVALLFATNEAALKVAGIRFCTSGLQLLREVKTLGTTEGTLITQTFIRSEASFSATAAGNGTTESYTEELPPRSQGWEYIEELNLPGHAAEWAQVAVEKLQAKSVEAGRYDLILQPTNLWLTIHESIGHPTELDRAMGFEANFAGTSFVNPPEKMINKLQYGKPLMNIQGDRTQEHSVGLCAWDDEGVPADKWLIIEKGIFKEYQTTREQAAWVAPLTGVKRSHGCSYADSWDDVQFQRMPNVSLLPAEKDITLNDIVSATDRGIMIRNRGSWSIDHQRYNFSFSGQAFYEIKGGKVGQMLKDVAYQAVTPVFWNSMDMIGGKSSYWLGGTFSDGKGEPQQLNSISHGCPPARFRDVNIINTGRNV